MYTNENCQPSNQGNLGVTSFQVALTGIILDALGPTWKYFDDWPKMVRYLRTERHVTKDEADAMRARCRRKITISPTEQEDLALHPFNITDGSWVRSIRERVCGDAALSREKPRKAADGSQQQQQQQQQQQLPCTVFKLQNHWQHAGFLFRYRRFLAGHVFRSPQSLRAEYVDPVRPAIAAGLPPGERERYLATTLSEAGSGLPDLVVYLRLGDKVVAGDTLLTFQSGYYEAVLKQARPRAARCWIVTQTPQDPRASGLASAHRCSLVSSPSQYTDWTLLLLAPKVLVMAASTFVYFQALIGAATEVHFPAVGFTHDQHNVCMRRRNSRSHFGQIRLPLPDRPAEDPKVNPDQFGGGGGARMVYHDIYARQFFLSYDEFYAEMESLPCESILDQHVCDLDHTAEHFKVSGAEGRYCYRNLNATTRAAAEAAASRARRAGGAAVAAFRSSRGRGE